MAYIKDIMRKRNVDIMCINETKLCGDRHDTEISGYTFYQKERVCETGRDGGGVAMYVRKGIPHTRREKNLQRQVYARNGEDERDDPGLFAVFQCVGRCIDRRWQCINYKLIIESDHGQPDFQCVEPAPWSLLCYYSWRP